MNEKSIQLNNNRFRSLPEIIEPRHSLMEVMDKAAKKGLMYIHAPAGYGKTVSALLWLKDSAYKSAWVDLSDLNNSSASFVNLLCAALIELQNDNKTLRNIISDPSFEMELKANAAAAIGSLAADDNKKYAVVFDDMHNITDTGILALLPWLLSMAPDNFLFIFISRQPPPDSFSAFTLRDCMGLIDVTKLKFSGREIKNFFRSHNCVLTLEETEETELKTDGWAIALNALVIAGEFTNIRNIGSDNENRLYTFIKDQIWNKWPEKIRLFAMKASVLSRMTPEICKKVTDEDDSAQILKSILDSNTFISLTGSCEYRFHDLFREFLGKMLLDCSKIDKNALYLKAAKCLLADEQFYMAIDLFIKCKDYSGAQDVLFSVAGFDGKITATAEHIDIYKRFIKGVLSNDEIGKYPFILLYSAWASYLDGDADSMLFYIDIVRKVFPKWFFAYPQYIKSAAMTLYIDFRTGVVSLAKNFFLKLLNVAPEQKIKTASVAINMPFYHRSHRDYSDLSVNMDKNLAFLEKAVNILYGNNNSAIKVLCIRAGLQMEKGLFGDALDSAGEAGALLTGDSLSELRFCSMMIMMDVLYKKKETGAARKMQNDIAAMLENEDSSFLKPNFKAYVCRLEILSGKTQAAREWIDKYAANLTTGLTFYQIYQHFTTVIAYLAVGEYSAAILFLSKLQKLCKDYNRPLDLIEAYILSSIAHRNIGSTQNALTELEKGVDIAYKYGFTALFAYCGFDISAVFDKLCKKERRENNADKNRLRFIKILHNLSLESKTASAVIKPAAPKKVKLSKQQNAVLALLAEGFTYAEIAAELNLSLSTVKTHIKGAYEKLDVNNSQDAIVKFEEIKKLVE